ncbi:TIGR02996 domain-containing protein [Frigoriglobus tundricola]|uniref:TIGR02996 domain-containing protein n=1 Tax=Frigoriglobus tundricola TaxID=2774151 RepID=A0A6M5YTI0_9BACT|nr:TIGR02996 domain-containing protein [Frigoriglobus tundricola]QJW96571.1 hypothetical protein FTUN_4128 [Frigoriglobus tundricola]
MSDRLAFLRAIRASPDDDTARLAFADWLDEHDDPLGAFVRVQVELEPIRYRIDNPRAVELHRREDELLRHHGDDWIGTNELLTHPSDFGPVFRRGLPDYACLSLDTFLTNGEALFAAHPTLREVALYGIANRCSELTLSPLLAKLDTLEIADWPTEDDAISLSVSPHLDRISRFKLWLGGEPHFLRELVKQANTRWPQEIELVQVYGGFGCFTSHEAERAREQNNEADSFAREANKTRRRKLVRVARPFEQLFPLNGKLNGTLCAGRLPNGNRVLASGSVHHWFLTTFTQEGYCLNTVSRLNGVRYLGVRAGTPEFWLELEASFHEWVSEELQLQPDLIWVREFDSSDVRVALWSYPLGAQLENSGTRRENETEFDWRSRGGNARGWLERRNFVIQNGPEHHADWRGHIHSS